MKTKYFLGLLSGLMFLSGCEEGFTFSTDSGAGRFSKQSILLDVRDDEETIFNSPSRAANDLADFKVMFFKNNGTVPEASYIYSEMPDVIVLPVGLYTVTATKGVDVEADWESPYFLGQSSAFQIKKDSITSDVDPIICRMQNVKVSVEFDPVLVSKMSADSYVEVKVGDNAGLKFDKSKEGTAGHFKHTDGVSLVATFNGVVEEAETVETKSFDEVKKGHHYKIKFKLHSQDPDNAGQATGEVNVDASVSIVNTEVNVTVGEDIDLGDGERPVEGNEDPENPPAPPVSGEYEPTFEVVAPTALKFNEPYNVTDEDIESGIRLIVRSNPGFSEFTVDIISPDLTPEELESASLSSHLDLVNPGDLATPLAGLGFPVNIGGDTEVEFSIPQLLMQMLTAVGEGNTHTFRLTVSNEYQGEKHTVTKDLILKL